MCVSTNLSFHLNYLLYWHAVVHNIFHNYFYFSNVGSNDPFIVPDFSNFSLFYFFLINLAKDLSVLLISPKNKLLNSLNFLFCFSIPYFIKINSNPYFSFFLLALASVCSSFFQGLKEKG